MEHKEQTVIAKNGCKKRNKDKKLTEVILWSFFLILIFHNLGFLLVNLAQCAKIAAHICECAEMPYKKLSKKSTRKFQIKKDPDDWLKKTTQSDWIWAGIQEWLQNKNIKHKWIKKLLHYILYCQVKVFILCSQLAPRHIEGIKCWGNWKLWFHWKRV